ncbi:MAG: type II secretion system F family protein [Acidimicrobiia bacterium]|nr:type II secretion system F family protein [Acidimicrobiia bacterium]
MTVWRYIAVGSPQAAGNGPGQTRQRAGDHRRRGEITGATAADARASLRRLGLRVIDLRPAQRRSTWHRDGLILNQLRAVMTRHLRRRRIHARAELCDSLATMLESGLTLTESVQTLTQSLDGRSRSMMQEVQSSLQAGDSLATALSQHQAWYDTIDVAMVSASEHAGTLPVVLRRLAMRHLRGARIGQRLAAALAYPVIVLIVGCGVALFLSVRTLPPLIGILTDAGVSPPLLSVWVMTAGHFVVYRWVLIASAALGLVLMTWFVATMLQRCGLHRWQALACRRPRLMRRMAVGAVATELASMLKSGVPLAEGLRLTASTTYGTDRAGLRAALRGGADALAGGAELSIALNDPTYFDAEFRRLLAVGERTGDLDQLLERIGQRYERRAERRIERLTALLEPLVILILAALVGTVVMAAVLPLIRLQEIL